MGSLRTHVRYTMANADTNINGSDIKVGREHEFDFLADTNGENELLEVQDPVLQDELAEFARQIFADKKTSPASKSTGPKTASHLRSEKRTTPNWGFQQICYMIQKLWTFS